MVKENIVDHLTHNCGLRRASAIAAVNGFIEIASSTLAAGENISLRGLGTFKIVEIAEKQGRNLRTGEPMTLQAHKVVRFIPAMEIKEALKDING